MSPSLDRSAKTRRSAPTLHADFVALIDEHVGTGPFEEHTGSGIAGQCDAPTWRNRQDVGAKRLEFLVGHLDQRVSEVEQTVPEWHSEQRRVDNEQIVIDRAEDRHQMKDIAGPPPVRERDNDELDAF